MVSVNWVAMIRGIRKTRMNPQTRRRIDGKLFALWAYNQTKKQADQMAETARSKLGLLARVLPASGSYRPKEKGRFDVWLRER